jgi:hypothetical protein
VHAPDCSRSSVSDVDVLEGRDREYVASDHLTDTAPYGYQLVLDQMCSPIISKTGTGKGVLPSVVYKIYAEKAKRDF